MYANSVGVKLLRLIQVQKIKKISSLLVYVHYYEIRHFHFVVVQKWQRNVQKSVMPAFPTLSLSSKSSDLKAPKIVNGDGGGSRSEPNYTTTSGRDQKYLGRFKSGPEQLAVRNPFSNG